MSSVRQGRIPHAQLFLSKEGNGGLALALAFAQFVACLDREENDSCGKCSSCVKYKQLIHPDLHFTFPIHGTGESCDSFISEFRKAFIADPFLSLGDWFLSLDAENKKPNITMKECQNIVRKLALKPYESDFKILILWLPEFLGREGNVLLKLIEEPPSNTLFLLVTENQDAILTTIISRTQTVKVAPYTYADVEKFLNERGIAEGDLAKNISLMCEGNLNKAMKLASQIDIPQFETFRSWLLDCYQGNITKIMSEMEKYSDSGREGLKMFFTYGIHMLRSAMLGKYQDLSTKLSANELEFSGKLSKIIDLESAQVMYEGFNDAIFEIERNGSVKLILINLSLKLKNCLRPKPVTTS